MREMKFRMKTCAECGAKFTPTSGRSKYCPACIGDVVRRQTADRVRRCRERAREHEEIVGKRCHDLIYQLAG